jgi:hypothetical protein
MPSIKPYYTTDTMINSIKLRIMFPASQNSLTYNDICTFLNEELQINAVPAIRELHDEYFVYKCPPTPLVNGISRYPIPNRAQGMAVRDINWSDSSGNFFKMSRIAPEEKSFYQQNVGSNQAIGKYYVEGNEIVITPQVSTGATGSLNFFIFLRPNHLVRNDRAAVIEGFQKALVVSDNALMSVGDTIVITTGNQTPSPVMTTLTAVSGSPGSGEFLIGATAAITASNINTAINDLGLDNVSCTVSTSISTVGYTDITTTFSVASSGIVVDNTYTYIQFDQLPTTYTDPETDITETLYETNGLVDFLQTNPGHRTYTYDIKLRQILPGNVGKFKTTDLKTYINNSSGGNMGFVSIEIGDYICLANECIIPQIPPELHSKLAEMVAARILMAIGDRDGLAISMGKLAEMDKQQATLIGQRIESSVPKVFNQFSLLRLGKRGRRRI